MRTTTTVKLSERLTAPEKYPSCKLTYTPEQKRYLKYIQRAASKGIAFDMSFAQFVALTQDNCVYCGNKGYSVDRINSKQGYEQGNIQPICRKCNTMKYTYTEAEFITHIQSIVAHLKL